MAESAAWVLALDHQLRAAVGERELVHLIETPILLDVPRSPHYCRQVLVWNDTVLPAMDLAAWLRGQSTQRQEPLAGVFAYQTRPGADPEYGALLLSAIPTQTRVDDDQVCALPKQPGNWQTLAISCFQQGDQPIPILDLPHIFSGGLL
ncbi:MAG: chemotaxis protein CheW [Candidatus Contendobacter sp.]|nr:chemotaxis protein CheW [Candidatus Contendobacter sp.]MDS4057912.1 chemotaxis protein CheW [Candidatus Contendobacter sp.]